MRYHEKASGDINGINVLKVIKCPNLLAYFYYYYVFLLNLLIFR